MCNTIFKSAHTPNSPRKQDLQDSYCCRNIKHIVGHLKRNMQDTNTEGVTTHPYTVFREKYCYNIVLLFMTIHTPTNNTQRRQPIKLMPLIHILYVYRFKICFLQGLFGDLDEGHKQKKKLCFLWNFLKANAHFIVAEDGKVSLLETEKRTDPTHCPKYADNLVGQN